MEKVKVQKLRKYLFSVVSGKKVIIIIFCTQKIFGNGKS